MKNIQNHFSRLLIGEPEGKTVLEVFSDGCDHGNKDEVFDALVNLLEQGSGSGCGTVVESGAAKSLVPNLNTKAAMKLKVITSFSLLIAKAAR
uniref:Put protein n=1 Tax=Boechera divaricarpa TaxID=115915 RepID=B2BXS7_9BRAS|nr:put protein [Boechera divaricarpa]